MTGIFEEKIFFAALAAELRHSGVLQPFLSPVQTAADFIRVVKQLPERIALPATPAPYRGEVRFIGDEPYTGASIPQPKEMVLLRRVSVEEAIKRYIPDEAFLPFLRHFVTHATAGIYETPIQHALDIATEELQYNNQKRYNSYVLARAITPQKFHALKDHHARYALADSTHFSREAPKHIALIATMVLYQAAHFSYLEQLEAAIGALPGLTSEEKRSAAYVFKEPFAQFINGHHYKGLVSSVILHHPAALAEEAAKAEIETREADPHNAMHHAILRGMRAVYTQDIFHTHYIANSGSPTSKPEDEVNAQERICPAHIHIRTTTGTPVIDDSQHLPTHDAEGKRIRSTVSYGEGLFQIYHLIATQPQHFEPLLEHVSHSVKTACADRTL